MSVGTHAEKNQIEAGKFSGFEFEEAAKLSFIIGGRGVGIGILSGHAKNIVGGNGDFREQRFLHHAVIAFGIGWRNMTFVAEKQKDTVPGEVGVVRSQQGIETFGSRAAGEGDRKPSLGADRRAGRADEFFSGSVEKVSCGREHVDGSDRGHENW